MKKFAIHYHSYACASLTDRKTQQTMPLPAWKFAFQGSRASVWISDLLKDENGINLHQGLKFITEVQADSQQEAEAIAKGHCELLLNLITLTTQVSCPGAKLQGIIEIVDSLPFPFASFSYPLENNQIDMRSLRKIDEDRFGSIFNRFMSDSQGRNRIMRALTWLRKGINEKDPTDEFISYWVGIEVIAALLRDKIKMRVQNATKWSGIEDIFVQKLTVSYFSEIKDARDELLHGYMELDSAFITKIHSYRDQTRRALILGILDLLNIPREIETGILGESIVRSGGQIWMIAHGSLDKIPINCEELVNNFPHLQTSFISSTPSLKEDAKINQSLKVNHKYIGPSEGIWTIVSTELHGDSDAGIDSAEVSISDLKQ